MNKFDLRYIKQSVTSAIISGILVCLLFNAKDLLSKIVILLFLIFGISFCARNILLVFRKDKLAEKVSKVYVIAFFIYWFGFLIYWDYVSIVNKDFMSVIFSLLMWFGGGYIIYKRFFKKKDNIK